MTASQEKQRRFMELFEPVQQNLERFALAMTGDTETARDVIAETVMIAYERFGTLRSPQAFLGFLFTVATRVHRAQRRKRERTERLEEAMIADLLAPDIPPDTAADVAAVYAALQRLPEKQREAIVLFEIMGTPIKEIREIQGGTITAVKVRLSRGRRKLAELLGVSDTHPMPAQEPEKNREGTDGATASPDSHQLYSLGAGT